MEETTGPKTWDVERTCSHELKTVELFAETGSTSSISVDTGRLCPPLWLSIVILSLCPPTSRMTRKWKQVHDIVPLLAHSGPLSLAVSLFQLPMDR